MASFIVAAIGPHISPLKNVLSAYSLANVSDVSIPLFGWKNIEIHIKGNCMDQKTFNWDEILKLIKTLKMELHIQKPLVGNQGFKVWQYLGLKFDNIFKEHFEKKKLENIEMDINGNCID